jgi:hypothetical protein
MSVPYSLPDLKTQATEMLQRVLSCPSPPALIISHTLAVWTTTQLSLLTLLPPTYHPATTPPLEGSEQQARKPQPLQQRQRRCDIPC